MLYKSTDFYITLKGVSMNNHFISGSNQEFKVMIDSGTTFTYLPRSLFQMIENHFKWFCASDPENNCKGKLMFDKPGFMCWEYDSSLFPDGPSLFMKSLPILRFTFDSESGPYSYDWYPSEYLYMETDQQYCVAADIQS